MGPKLELAGRRGYTGLGWQEKWKRGNGRWQSEIMQEGNKETGKRKMGSQWARRRKRREGTFKREHNGLH